MNTPLRRLVLATAIASLLACSSDTPPPESSSAAVEPVSQQDSTETSEVAEANPLLMEWDTPFGVPPFDQIRVEHIAEGLDRGMQEQVAEVEAILANTAPVDFDNTMAAMERSGRTLSRVGSVFGNLAGTNSTPELQALQAEYAPRLSAHGSSLMTNQDLFARVDTLYRSAEEMGLNDEQKRLVSRWHNRFVRAGAALDEATRERVAAIDQRTASLTTAFGRNNLRDTDQWQLVLESEEELAGLPGWLRAAAAQAAADRDLEGKYVITLQRSSLEPFLTFSENRELREKAYQGWTNRGNNDNEYDNKKVIAELVALRAERAQLMGFENHADFIISDNMARSADAAMDLLVQVWEPALVRAKEERDDIQAMIEAEGGDFEVAKWDWFHYAEQVRQQRFDISDEEVKPYFEIDKMTEAAFYVGNRLFGISVEERPDLPVYHPDVRAYEVLDAEGEHLGVFYTDFYARQGKRSGAWMSSFRGQNNLDERVRPIVINVLNVNKAPAGEPTLLSYDDANTLFHEFGHALHGLLSNVTYPSLAGTSVARDFVEFPSQIFEHWLNQPEVLSRFAVHYETGEPMPQELLARLEASSNFNQGYRTVEFLASGLMDMAYHQLTPEQAKDLDVAEFERTNLERLGMIPEIAMRHRSTHFGHIFSGGYAAGYYAYLWSEVLDADGFKAFEETGDVFDPATAKRLHDNVFAAGNVRDPMDAWMGFRGAEPSVRALLEKRGFPVDDAGEEGSSN